MHMDISGFGTEPSLYLIVESHIALYTQYCTDEKKLKKKEFSETWKLSKLNAFSEFKNVYAIPIITLYFRLFLV